MAFSLRNFYRNESGNVAAMTALSMLVLLGAVGAAFDFSMAASSQSRSQDIADQIALRAAAFVRENDGIPTDGSGGIAAGTYTAAELGYDYKGWVKGGGDEVTIEVTYDEDNNQAIVTVRGLTVSNFGNLMGMKEVPFSTQSVVGFEVKEIKNVASIALVLDNSGSMEWDDKPHTSGGSAPSDAVGRIVALENSMISFMKFLSPMIESESSEEQRVLRLGMLAYNQDRIGEHQTPMNWKLISDHKITKMEADGGTNPTTSMTTAADWMVGEPAKHMSANQKVPLRYVVFMSDGANDNAARVWTDQAGSGEWRRQRCRYSEDEFGGWGCWYEYKLSASQPSGNAGFWKSNSRYDYAWYEGTQTRPDDDATLAQCQRMKDDGVTVYTIAFGLESGTYDRNETIWDVYEGENSSTVEIDPLTTTRAYDFLSKCASSAETFMKAENADELQTAFDFIGENIVKEGIRIKS